MPLPADDGFSRRGGGTELVLMDSHGCSSTITWDVLLGHAACDLALRSLMRKSPSMKTNRNNPIDLVVPLCGFGGSFNLARRT